MGDSSLFRVGQDIALERVLAHLCVLVVGIFLFEIGLHRLEHKVARSRKFEKMVNKTYRELMVLGFIGLGLKIAKETSHSHAVSATMLALQIADLMVFILALALVLQAACVFLRLRSHDARVERAELMTIQEMVERSGAALNSEHSPAWQAWLCKLCRRRGSTDATISADGSHQLDELDELIKLRLLRRQFLCRFGLPQLFPFAKYLRKAQDNQISHMIDVELSTWIVLLAIAWALEGFTRLLEHVDSQLLEKHAVVGVFVAFAWALVGLHAFVYIYFRSCVQQLLLSAGYSTNPHELHACLVIIAREETMNWSQEVASEALDAMEAVQEHHEAKELARHRRHWIIEFDTGLQLVATVARNVKAFLLHRERNASSASNSMFGDAHVKYNAFDRRASMPPIHIRWFSRKAWHFLIILLLMLNGFYLALLLQCVAYQFGAMYRSSGLPLIVAAIIPLCINVLLFQPGIFRHYVLVTSIFRVDVRTLSEVVHHFNEIVELRSEFVAAVSARLKDSNRTLADLRREMVARDSTGSGEIELAKLRVMLRALGFRMSNYRFNSVIKLLFCLRGMRVQYEQVLSTLALADCSDFPRLQDRRETMIDETAASHFVTEPALTTQHPLMRRHQSTFACTSSRTVLKLFHVDSISSLDLDGPPAGQTNLDTETSRGQTPYIAM